MCLSDRLSCQRWRWVSGDSDVNQSGHYGIRTVADPNNKPPVRIGSVGWSINSDLFLFGGNAGGSQYLNDLWRYNLSDDRWTWISGSDGSNSIDDHTSPSARMADTGCRMGYQLVLFGGFNSNGYLNDLWIFNTLTQQWQKRAGSDGYNQQGHYGVLGIVGSDVYPGARSAAISWQIGSDFFLFGGLGKTSDASYLNDLWRFNIQTGQWCWISGDKTSNQLGHYGTKNMPSDTNRPGARSGAIAWTVENKLFLFGGIGYSTGNTTQLLNDLWQFNPGTNQWTWLAGDGTGTNLSPNYGSIGIASDTNQPGSRTAGFGWAVGQQLFLFGGHGHTQSFVNRLNDLWKFDLNTRMWTWLSGSQFGNDVGRYHSPKKQISALNLPSARFGGVSWTVGSDKFLWGGAEDANGTQLKNDLWQWIQFCPCPLALDVDVQVNVSAFGRSDGFISVVASGGISPYGYLWNTGAQTSAMTNLKASDYSVTLTDSHSDTITLHIKVSEPAQLAVIATTITSDSATAIATGGIPPYTYLWDNGDKTIQTQGALAGIRTVIVTDAYSDKASDTVFVPGARCPLSAQQLKTVSLTNLELVGTAIISDHTFCVGFVYLATFYVSLMQYVEKALLVVYRDNWIVFESDVAAGFHSIPLKTPQTPGAYNLQFVLTDFSDICSDIVAVSLMAQDFCVQFSDLTVSDLTVKGYQSTNGTASRIVNVYQNQMLVGSLTPSSDSNFSESCDTLNTGNAVDIISVEAYCSDKPNCRNRRIFQKNRQIFCGLEGSALSFILTSNAFSGITVSASLRDICSEICAQAKQSSDQKLLATLMISNLSDMWGSDAILQKNAQENVFVSCSDTVLTIEEIDHLFTLHINFSDASDFSVIYSDRLTVFSDHQMTENSLVISDIFGPPQIVIYDLSVNSDRNRVTVDSVFPVDFKIANAAKQDVSINVLFGNYNHQGPGINGLNAIVLPAPQLPSDYVLIVQANITNCPDVSNTASLVVEALPIPIVSYTISDTVRSDQTYILVCEVDIIGGSDSDFLSLEAASKSGRIYKQDVYNQHQGSFSFAAPQCGSSDILECTFEDPRTSYKHTQIIPVTFKQLPVVTVTANPSDTVCVGTPVTLTASGANTYLWFDGSDGASHTFLATVTSDYSVTGISNNGCSGNAAIHITVKRPPVVTVRVSPSDTVCFGTPVTLTALGADSYLWFDGSDGNSRTFSATVTSDYSVLGINRDCAESDHVTIHITANQPPVVTVTASPSDTVCFGTPVTLTAFGANTYHWFDGSDSDMHTFTPTKTSDYKVTGFIQNSGCFSDASILITIKTPIAVNAGSDQIISRGSDTIIGVGSALSDTIYTWSPTNGISDIHAFPTKAHPMSDTTYTVIAKRTDVSGCVTSDSVIVRIMLPVVFDNAPRSRVSQNLVKLLTMLWLLFVSVLSAFSFSLWFVLIGLFFY